MTTGKRAATLTTGKPTPVLTTGGRPATPAEPARRAGGQSIPDRADSRQKPRSIAEGEADGRR